MGRHTKHGGYIVDWAKVHDYAVPDLTNCTVRRIDVSLTDVAQTVRVTPDPADQRHL
jgi:hypothetical protein